MKKYAHVFSARYCTLSCFLTYETPIAYTCGIFGWNADVYQFDELVIITGYRPFGMKIPDEIRDRYEFMAKSIINNGDLENDAKRNSLHCLTSEMCNELKALTARVIPKAKKTNEMQALS